MKCFTCNAELTEINDCEQCQAKYLTQFLIFEKKFQALFMIWGIMRSNSREKETKEYSYSFYEIEFNTNHKTERVTIKAKSIKELVKKINETKKLKCKYIKQYRIYNGD